MAGRCVPKEQRTDGGCSSMDLNKFRRVDKERVKTNEGAEIRVARKRPREEAARTLEERDSKMVDGAGFTCGRGQRGGGYGQH